MEGNPNSNPKKNNNAVKEFFQVKEVFGYFFRKKDPSRPKNFNIRAMHIINKIAILLFLVCVFVIIKRFLFGY
jgi:hypothetical protein